MNARINVAEPLDQQASLAGSIERVLLHKPETGYTVLRLRVADGSIATVVGAMPPPATGELLRATGAWYDDRSWGRQFRAESIALEPPDSPEGLITYLGSGRIKGLGEVVARRLVERFHPKLGEILEREPERVREVPGVGPKLVERLAESWKAQRRERDLLVFLAGHGIGGRRATRILESWGETARQRLHSDPYALARDIRGIGFKTADRIALSLGLPGDSPQRLDAALAEVLREAAEDGHTGLLPAELLSRLQGMTGSPAVAATAALGRELDAKRLVEREGPSGPVVMLKELDDAEAAIARGLLALAAGEPAWGQVERTTALARAEASLGVKLAPAQSEAIGEALTRRLLVITGGPGTGKTTLVRGILTALADVTSEILLAAPTGRAARRLAESTGRPASTLHRLLEADPERGFRRNGHRPLAGDLVVVDEASMVDTLLMAGLVAALPPDASLILVGDVDQLPSIGAGQVLADILGSERIPSIRLEEVFRQAQRSGIVVNAHRVNRGELPIFDRGDGSPGDFFGIKVKDSADAAAKLVDLVATRMPERFGLDPWSEIQVLTPIHRGGAGTRALNEALRTRLNGSPALTLGEGEHRVALGDRVMQLENDYERELYNGDIGRVTGIDPQAGNLTLTLDSREVTLSKEGAERLGLAYAITVHKAQGSEYPAVVIPLLREHGRMLRRDLLYTALTRARRLVVLLVEPEALARAVRTISGQGRSTLLARRLIEPEDECRTTISRPPPA